MSTNSSLSTYPFHQHEAVRIQAQILGKDDGDDSNLSGTLTRRFSVDPALTDFIILRNLIGRAFDLKGDFVIHYRASDDYGSSCWLPLVSDWDLGAAFLSACSPELHLMIQSKKHPAEVKEPSSWEMINSGDVQTRTDRNPSSSSRPILTQQRQKGFTSLNATKINTTGLFNAMERFVQKALTFVEDMSVVTSRPPVSDVEFRNYLDGSGILMSPKELRYASFHGGVEPSLRRVVWKHLLNVYPDGLNGIARIDYIRTKSKEYFELRDEWKSFSNGAVMDEILGVSNMVRKDVLRTDRHLAFFSGQDEESENIRSLFNILTTYALNHPTVSYCQGMSDLASPLLVTMGDEAQAYICFCSLMERLSPNFNSDGLAMSLKFAHLSDALAHSDPEFWSYLKTVGGDDLLFCYRWLLLEMKREFVFEDALRMMEVLWASLPHKPRHVPLFEVRYTGSSKHSLPIAIPSSLTSSYSKVCAIRRSSITSSHNYHPSTTDIRNRRYSRNKNKTSPHLSLDENSLTSVSSSMTISDDLERNSNRKQFYSLDETMEVLSCSDFPESTSPFEILTVTNSPPAQPPRLIKNLREFWEIGRRKQYPNSQAEASSSGQGKQGTASAGKKSGQLDVTYFKDARKSSSSNTENETPEPNGYMEQKINLDDEIQCVHDMEKEKFIQSQNHYLNDAVFSDSENDSGHCYSDSVELENSLEEPAFQSPNQISASTASGKNGRLHFQLPAPEEFGGGNPFLMFLCITMLLQHRDHIMKNQMDYNETAMYFDKMVRKHNVGRVLGMARQMYSNYLKQNTSPKV